MLVLFTGNLTKSGSESSLSDACETTSAKESARKHDEKDTCSDNEETQQYAQQKEEQIDSCDEAKQEYDNEKDLDIEKDDLAHKTKLQKQGHVMLRRKSKGNPLYRKSKSATFIVILKFSQIVVLLFNLSKCHTGITINKALNYFMEW